MPEPYDTMINQILEVSPKKTNPFLDDETRFPLGTRQPLDTYDDINEVTDDEIVWYNINSSNFMPTEVIGKSGTMKTCITKRIVYYLRKLAGNKLLIADPKLVDWCKACYKPRSTAGLLKDELPDYLPIETLAPSYIEKDLTDNIRPYINKIITAPPFGNWRREDFYTLEFSPVGTEYLISRYFKRNITDPQKILTRLPFEKAGGAMSSTRQALVRRIASLVDTNFINKKYPQLDIPAIWKTGKVPSLHFFSQSAQAMSFFVQLAVQSIFKELNINPTPATIFIGDAPIICGLNEQGKSRPATETLIKVLTQWRALKLNVVLETQGVDLIDPRLSTNFVYYILGRVGNSDALRRVGFSNEIVKATENLVSDQEKHHFEYIKIAEDMQTYEKFFALSPPIGHFMQLAGI